MSKVLYNEGFEYATQVLNPLLYHDWLFVSATRTLLYPHSMMMMMMMMIMIMGY